MCTDFYDAMFTIEIHQIDRKSHPEGVHRFTGYDPEPFSAGQALSPQQPLASARPIAGELNPVRDLNLAS